MELNNKDKLIKKLKQLIKAINTKDESFDASCIIIQQTDGEYKVDIHEYL